MILQAVLICTNLKMEAIFCHQKEFLKIAHVLHNITKKTFIVCLT